MPSTGTGSHIKPSLSEETQPAAMPFLPPALQELQPMPCSAGSALTAMQLPAAAQPSVHRPHACFVFSQQLTGMKNEQYNSRATPKQTE